MPYVSVKCAESHDSHRIVRFHFEVMCDSRERIKVCSDGRCGFFPFSNKRDAAGISLIGVFISEFGFSEKLIQFLQLNYSRNVPKD